MRGRIESQVSVLCLFSLEQAVPSGHPIRAIRKLADRALRELETVFNGMYSELGRPSIPPERLLKAMVLMALYSIRSERMFCERLRYDLLFRWFLDLELTEPPFDATSFGKNRERLLQHDVAGLFFAAVVSQARAQGLMSDEHFSVDGTLIQAWSSLKSFRPKSESDAGDGNGWGCFRGQRRTNETHASRTDPESRLMRKGHGQPAVMSFSTHALMENRNGLLLDLRVAEANGRAERQIALEMVDDAQIRAGTLGADRGYDTRDFVEQCRRRGITPHVAQHTVRRGSAVDGRTTRWPGYSVSQLKRRLLEQTLGWVKTVAGLRRTRYRGISKTQLYASMSAAAYNLLRIARLVPQPT